MSNDNFINADESPNNAGNQPDVIPDVVVSQDTTIPDAIPTISETVIMPNSDINPNITIPESNMRQDTKGMYSETLVSNISDEKEINLKDIKEDESIIVLPNSTVAKLQKLIDVVEALSNDSFKQNFSTKDTSILGININASAYSNDRDAYHNKLNNDKDAKYINRLSYGGKDLTMRPIGMNSKAKALSGDSAIAKISSILGVGEIIQIPLYHSGFWITLKPILDTELINLEMQIASSQIELGRTTNNLIYSNYAVVYVRIIVDFIISKIQSQTISLDEDDDIRDFILIQDLYIIATGLLYSMYPNGYSLVRPCVNSLEVDENNTPKCDFILSAKLNFRWLIHTNFDALTKEHKEHMANRSPNSVTKLATIEYINTLNINKPKTYTYDINGDKIEVELISPMLSTYITDGELWVNSVIENTRSLFTDTTSIEEKNRIVNETANSVILNIYNTYISKISFSDGSYIKDKDGMNDIIGILSSDEGVFNKIINDITAYIDTNVIAIAGLPDFTCPKCKLESQNANSVVAKDFVDIIPLNLLQIFFVLSARRVDKARMRHIS